jgi:hypothetical protein
MKEFLIKHSSGKKVLIWFFLANLFYVLMVAVTIPKVMHFANGIKILDMLPSGYDFEYVNTLLLVLGEEGRSAYLFQQIPLDMIYPFLFAASYSLLLVFLLKKLDKTDTPWFYLAYLPLVAGLSDYAENLGIITLLNQFPNISETSVQVSNVFSLVKSSSTTVYFVALLVVLIWVVINWLQHKVSKNKTEN